jgi:hypothetical protein
MEIYLATTIFLNHSRAVAHKTYADLQGKWLGDSVTGIRDTLERVLRVIKVKEITLMIIASI